MSEAEPDLSALPQYVQERWPVAVERATRKTASAVPNQDANKLLKVSQKASTAAQRIVWLQRAASAWAKPLEEVAACRRGCAHCCHISVTISSAEAALIGRHVGKKPVEPAHAVRLGAFTDAASAHAAVLAIGASEVGAPCPFLVDGACSIYEVRPMACRLLLNLDDDDLLCRLIPGQAVPVPYANSEQRTAQDFVLDGPGIHAAGGHPGLLSEVEGNWSDRK